MVRLCLAGEGAQGFTHYATLSEIPGAEVVTLCGGVADDTEQFAKVRSRLDMYSTGAAVPCTFQITPSQLVVW